MTLAEDNGMIEALPADRAYQSLHIPRSAKVTARPLRPTPAITTNAEHTCPWTRTRRAVGQSNGSASSLLGLSSADFIISIAGFSFW
jgi:hypothetical protein